jgi:hypothetical protein
MFHVGNKNPIKMFPIRNTTPQPHRRAETLTGERSHDTEMPGG